MMSNLKQQTLVACPLSQAKFRVTEFMKENGSTDGSVLHTPLGFALLSGGRDATFRLDHRVTIDISIASRITAQEASWDVEWKPDDGGPYPHFRGTLAVENDDYSSFWLILRGTYDPPFGLIGSAFDMLLGNRIAAQSARELLARMAASIEAGFAADEAMKPKAESVAAERGAQS